MLALMNWKSALPKAETLPAKLLSVPYNVHLHIVILMLLSCICFSRTLGSYFIADDFPEIAYVSSIFKGHPELFFSNFTGNYMQVPGMKVYRPGMFLTMVLDFLCYGGKAWGYFLSNFLYFTGDIVVLYFLCRALTANWGRMNSALFALFSAALFTVNPLHCETISWMVGRGDPASALFYLLSLLLFVHNLVKPRLITMLCSAAAFSLALSIKEMPVGLPVVTTVTAFFWKDAPSLRARALNALRFTLPFWSILVLYFLLRYLCLGTLGGGYVGGIGAQQIVAMLEHWTDRDTVERLLLPVTGEVARQSVFCLPVLRALISFVFSLVCLRLLSGCWSWRWIFFIFSLLLTTAAPIFQLWGLGPNLEGGRFYFFLSLPLSMMLPLLLFHPGRTRATTASITAKKTIDENLDRSAINPGRYGPALTTLCIVTQITLVVLLARITSRTNMLWVHAGREDFHLSQECQKLAAQTDKRKRILLLGIPDDYHGAHLILNRTMFELMLRPPFVAEDIGSRFVTTMPLMYGPEQYINGSRLKELLAQPDVIGPYVWLRDKQKFQRIELPVDQATETKTLTVPNSQSGNDSSIYISSDHHAGGRYSVLLDNLNLNPLAIDCLEFELDATKSTSEPVKIYWNGSVSIPAVSAGEFAAEQSVNKANGAKIVRVRLGRYWRWYALGRIRCLEIIPPAAETCRIRNIRLLPYASIAPTLTLQSADHYLTASSTGKLDLCLSKGSVPGTAAMELEVGKNNYFFDNFQGSNEHEPVACKIPLSSDATTFSLDKTGNCLSNPGYYQLRLRCLDKSRAPIGEYSDAVTVLR